MLIIDCHGHYTTAPAPHQEFRKAQLARLENPTLEPPAPADISDDQIRETIERNQLKLLRERGADLTIFSPRASAMAHHIGDPGTSMDWARANNDLIKRVVDLYPENFVGGAQLPQVAGESLAGPIEELDRAINELGFVGLQPEPGPVRRSLDVAAAHGPLLVPALRKTGGAGRAGNDPRFRQLQPMFSRDRCALYERRYDRVHAVIAGQPVRRLPGPSHDHSAWRWRGSVPLGTVPRTG